MSVDAKKVIQTVVGSDADLQSACWTLWQRGEAKLMELYGDQAADVVAKCHAVSPYFCFQVLTNIYAIWWRLPVITDFQKSVVTCCALLATYQVNQFNVLIETFFVSGGSAEQVSAIIAYMLASGYITEKVLPELPECCRLSSSGIEVDGRLRCLVDLASRVARRQDLTGFLQQHNHVVDFDTLVVAVNHLLTYLGCPVVWDSTMQLHD